MNLLQGVLIFFQRRNSPRGAQKFLKVWSSLFGSEQSLQELAKVSQALGDFDTAAQACRKLLAKNPNDLDATRNLAIFLLQLNDGPSAAQYFSKHLSLHGEKRADLRTFKNSLMDEEKHIAGIPYVKTFGTAYIETEFWSVMHEHNAYFRDVHDRTMPNCKFIQGRVTANGENLIYAFPAKIQEIKQPCILLGGDDNYSHWLMRNLIKLSLVDENLFDSSYKYLINEDMKSYQKQYLELLDIPPSRLLPVRRSIFLKCEKLIVPSLLRNRPKMLSGIEWLRDRLKKHLAPPGADTKIYISRRDSTLRAIRNERELEEELEKRGFKIIVNSALSVKEQLSIFSGAKDIVAPHGAGLTNIIFSPTDAKILEITSKNSAHMDLFRNIATTLGQTLHTLEFADYSGESQYPINHQHREFTVDIEKIIALL